MQHKEGQQHVNADALSRRPQNPGSGVVNNTHQETAAQVNSVGSDTEPLVPLSDMFSSPPSAVDPCTSDLTTGQQVDTDSESDMSFMHALSHDGTGLRELQKPLLTQVQCCNGLRGVVFHRRGGT